MVEPLREKRCRQEKQNAIQIWMFNEGKKGKTNPVSMVREKNSPKTFGENGLDQTTLTWLHHPT